MHTRWQKYVKREYELEVDEACKNIERLCFVSYNKLARWNGDATPLAPQAEPLKVKAARVPGTASEKAPGTGKSTGEPVAAAADLDARAEIAQDVLGAIDWESDTAGYCACPGIKTHTTGDARKDCRVTLDGVPTVFCLHNSCQEAVATANHELRSRIGKAEHGTQDEVIAALAHFGAIEYNRLREKYADELGCRTSTLDRLVAAARRQLTEGATLCAEWAVIEPWPKKVNGGELLDALIETALRFMVMPDAGVVATALWLLAGECFDVFQFSPILSIRSPERVCGKSKLLALLSKLVPKPLKADSVSDAVLYRAAGKWQPTLLLDEWDSLRPEMQDAVRNVLNSGFERGGCSWRCVGENFVPTRFATYCPKVVAGIGELPATAASRSIIIMLHRKLPSEKVESLCDFDAGDLRRKMVRWTLDNRDRLGAAKTSVPEALEDRQRDIWKPLFAIADLCGQGQLARQAALKLLEHREEDTIGVELLADVRRSFNGHTRLATEDLLRELNRMLDRPWPTLGKNGERLTAHGLGRMLGRFGIAPKNLRVVGAVQKGYVLEQLDDVFARYLPTPPEKSATTLLDP